MRFRLVPVLALILGLHGCATFSLDDAPPPISQLDAWMDSHQYGKVLNVLSKVPQNHPDYVHYAARRNIAEERAKIYEDSILNDVSKAEKNFQNLLITLLHTITWPGRAVVMKWCRINGFQFESVR